jgi:outer membrane protein OmpA-like peptidoglycan-associated protein
MRHLKSTIVRFGVICSFLGAALLPLLPIPAFGQEYPLPAELSFLSAPLKPYRMTYEPWVELQMPVGNLGKDPVGKLTRGKHWQFPVIVPGAKDGDAAWDIIKPAFLANGWTVVKEWTSGGRFLFLHYQKNGVEAWATTDPLGAEREEVEIVEIAPMPFAFTLAPPAATPETIVAATGDFPYLVQLPGSRLHDGVDDPTPFSVVLKGASQPEIVAQTSVIKRYISPDGLSNSLFDVAYRDAMVKVGWTIITEFMGADVGITAHYTKDGRNLWAALHESAGSYDIRVADAGAATKDLNTDLEKNCHVALYGVFFDFNKSTLQPASDPVLQQIDSLLVKNATLKLEIQGHTDNVGNDAYNQTLSEARALSVVAWLTQHGIAATRLTAKGYGKTKPIADNGTDAGRAKNRRVEIADLRCTAKAQ